MKDEKINIKTSQKSSVYLQRGFTLVELIVVITILGVIFAMMTPNFNMMRERARNTALKSNLHQTQVVIEVFHLEKGFYADDFYEDGYGSFFPGGKWDILVGKLPTNPWTGKVMDPDDFDTDEYDNLEDIANSSERGPNDDEGFDPGEIRYSTYTPPGRDDPTNWGLIGFDRNGRSLRTFDAQNEIVIFVLHN